MSAVTTKLNHLMMIGDNSRKHQHSAEFYQYLGRMPTSVTKEQQWSYILRLSTIIQLLEGDEIKNISDYRISAYVYAAVDEARGAFDGATGEVIDDFRSICVLPHRAWQVYCWCRKCVPRTSIINHLRHTAKAAPRYEDAPLIQTGIGRETCIRTLEQIWLLIPKHEVCPERQLLWDQLNASPSSVPPRSPSWQEMGSDDVDTAHQ
ncbi:unnamed protein product [Cylicostephanus goldi]|uniref:Uncharacterized protein n=1 Tax=Cylicostephanus goldi TaxID=71465 RepID=A0A3P6R298_CYLGO|nr:unnamed protein product [Cylicostephanus goldi]